MWRPRDRERYIGSYDPEHEMPDPDRYPGDRWQSDAYRHHFRDSRFAYRMNPDRFENRFEGRRDVDSEMQMRWNRDGRDRDRDYGYGDDRGYDRGTYARSFDRGGQDRAGYDRGYDRSGYDRGYDRSFERATYGNDYGFGGRGRAEWGMRGNMDRMAPSVDRDWDRGPGHFDRDRIYGSDRGWDRPQRNHDFDPDWRRRR